MQLTSPVPASKYDEISWITVIQALMMEIKAFKLNTNLKWHLYVFQLYNI